MLWILLSILIIIIALLTMPFFGKKRKSTYVTPFPAMYPLKFPNGFLWGCATAAQQIENMQPSDWTAFVEKAYKNKSFQAQANKDPEPGHILGIKQYPIESIRKTADFDAQMEADLQWAKENGQNSYRFSICWSRLFPLPGMRSPSQAGIDYYHKVLDLLEKYELLPSATLFHFSSPAWFWEEKYGRRGWERQDALEHFDQFTKTVAENFGDRINHWCTLNEPMVYVYNGYMNGLFPPLEKRPDAASAALALSTLLKAHRNAYDILHEYAQKKGRIYQVGYTKHTRVFEPYRNWAFLDRIIAGKVEQAFIWDFMDAIHTGELKLTNTDYKEKIEGLKGKCDYIGINYYGRFYVRSSIFAPTKFKIMSYDPKSKTERINDLRWAQYPHGFSYILEQTAERYKLPIYILENGTADRSLDDKIRQEFLVTHLRELWYQINIRQTDIRGFFHWSLTDNFEWAEGFDACFGLMAVDYANGHKRIPRKSAELFKKIIIEGITHNMEQIVKPPVKFY